ncbi:cation efflux protein [Meredithblackwellia eburnea MCA 4105]
MSSNSRSKKIQLLLVIDTAFFLLELISGVITGSLALISDSFHMLNDIFSLVVALQALKLAEGNSASSRYSYGWQRAEVLGALINGVFLLALCLSIGLEAFTRFFSGAEVTNPKLIVVVGSAGLVSNILGLLLFHDHGHSHGGHSHGHSHSHAGHSHGPTSASDLEAGKGKKVSKRSRSHSHGHSHSHSHSSERTPLLAKPATTTTATTNTDGVLPVAPAAASNTSTSSSTKVPDSNTSSDIEEEEEEEEDKDREAAAIEEELFVHPGEFRGNIVKQAHDAGYGATPSTSGHGHSHSHSHDHGAEGHSHEQGEHHEHGEHGEHAHEGAAADHGGHSHGGHSHDGSMNMQGVFLHVLGDALGNVGVIAAGLFIWLTDYSWRSYADPAISLLITCIIFSSALPLVKSASFILLQGVPNSVPLEEVRKSIAAVPGVLNVHELHIWSLSESKTVCSVHVMTSSEDFVPASRAIRRVLHRFGVHSSTIQPEIVGSHAASPSTKIVEPAEVPAEDVCQVLCVDDSCRTSSCCPPASTDGTTTPSS